MRLLFLCAAALAATALPAFAADAANTQITIHDDAVTPATLVVPAGERVKLQIKNARSVPAEFESTDLGREKVVPAGLTLDLWIGPLKPGKYKFFDDFNPAVTGWVEAVEAAK